MLEFEYMEEGSEVSLKRAELLKGFSPAYRFWKANISPYIFKSNLQCCSIHDVVWTSSPRQRFRFH